MSDTDTNHESAFERLQAFLNTVPYPPNYNNDISRIVSRFSKDDAAREKAGTSITVQLLSSFMTAYLSDYLSFMLARRGFSANIRTATYGSIALAVFDKSHELHTNPPDVILILPTFRDLAHCPPIGANQRESEIAVKKETEFWTNLWSQLPSPTVQLSFDTPAQRTLGDLDGFMPGGLTYHARCVNLALGKALPSSITFVDAECLSRDIGSQDWHNPHVYTLCKQPFSMSALAQVADSFSSVIQGVLGKARKVLVLDLDNTIWGGIIGDDGLDGIQLGPETPDGEAFISFQKYVDGLRRRGVIIAICSKNNADIALEAFKHHPAMVLKEEHIASFVANFQDKPANLKLMSEELNLGLNAFVFVDDSPVEREMMRQQLPEVLTIELPENPALYVRALESCLAFPLTHLTNDDLNRSASYKSRAITNKALSESTDIEAFLKSLNTCALVEAYAPGTKDRIVQLLQKTNQFKLNTNKFSFKELEKDGVKVLALRLKDRLQDYGIVTVAVLKTQGTILVLENWVMSCRVFSRRLEFLTFSLICNYASEKNLKTITCDYLPNARNSLVKDVLKALNFKKINKLDKY